MVDPEKTKPRFFWHRITFNERWLIDGEHHNMVVGIVKKEPQYEGMDLPDDWRVLSPGYKKILGMFMTVADAEAWANENCTKDRTDKETENPW